MTGFVIHRMGVLWILIIYLQRHIANSKRPTDDNILLV